MNWELHEGRARKIWRVLVKLARRPGRVITYTRLGEKVGVYHRHLNKPLGVIQRHCDKGPPLQALAVRKKKNTPGDGYYATATDPKSHAKAVARVNRAKWSDSPPRKWKNSRPKSSRRHGKQP